ncbi:MAG: RNA methyltransferase [Prevotellaceae bacterium]|nr:RNA methyltransferase [Prevotellaceae bacterium]
MRKLKITEMGRMNAEEFKASEKMPLVVLLDDVRSMYNVGSVFRTADAFRVESIYLCGITATPPHQEIHKTALGAEDTVEWKYCQSALEAVSCLKTAGYKIFSIEQCEGSAKLHDLPSVLDSIKVKDLDLSQGISNPQKFAIVLGNEVKGVSQDVVNASDYCLEIPQFGTKHSLNVSTAAGMVIWEFAKLLLSGMHN